MNVKWLRRLKVGTEPWHTRWETPYYGDLMPDGTAREFTFVMEAKSVITSPSGGQRLAGTRLRRRSPAWPGPGAGGSTRVDVSTDGGQTWTAATLQEPVRPIAWTRFRLPWMWDGQAAQLQSRAIDETGYVQPTHRAVGRSARRQLLLPLQRHQDLGHRGRWGGEQCLRLTDTSASAARRRRSRSPAGTSTSPLTGPGCRRGAARSQQGKELYARLGAKCHGAKGEGGEGGPPLVGGIGSLEHRCPAEDGRQLLAVRAGPLRLHPSGDAGRQPAVADPG